MSRTKNAKPGRILFVGSGPGNPDLLTVRGMEVLVKYLGYKPRLWLELICGAVIIVFLGFLVVEGIRLTLLNRERIFGDSTLSYAWVTAAVPVGCALLAASIAYNMAEAWRRQRDQFLVYTRSAAEQENPEVLEL